MDDLLARITHSPEVMGGKPCLRGMRVTVGTVVGLLAAGKSHQEVLADLPCLEEDDIRAALTYAAWRSEAKSTSYRSLRRETSDRSSVLDGHGLHCPYFG